MLSIETCRQLLQRPDLSDQEVARIRAILYSFAHALIDEYVRERQGDDSPQPQ